MNTTNDLKKFVKEILSKYSPNAYYLQCAPGKFPRIEYEIKQIGLFDGLYLKYTLTLNIYDKDTTQNIDDIADAICQQIGLSTYEFGEKYFIQFYKNDDKQAIIEADKTINRVMLTMEIRLYKRSEL